VIVHHVEMHEFCLWCDFKSLKKICEKSLKKIVKIGVKFELKKNESLNG
jgi:hypothetical protein